MKLRPREVRRRARRIVMLSLFVNAMLALVKITAGIVGNTYALVADGIESLADLFTSLIVWGGVTIATIPADDEHQYGHGKAEPLTAALVGILLLSAAGWISIESVNQIVTPQDSPAPFTLIVLVVVVVTKELLARKTASVAEIVGSSSIGADAWHHRSDAITSLAAFIGISLALVGGEGFEAADDWAALFASLVIAYNGWRIVRQALDEVMDRTDYPDKEHEIRERARKVPSVLAVDTCRIRKHGLGFFVDLHIVVDGSLSVREGHDIAREVRRVLCRSELNVKDVLVHVEPEDVLKQSAS